MIKLLPGPDADLDALRPFAAVKLIVADLDGTLFPSELHETAQRLLRQLRLLQVRLTVATGRTFKGVQTLIERLQGTRGNLLVKSDTPLILYNGSVLVEVGSGHLLKRTEVNLGVLNMILDISARYPCEVYAYFCDEDLFLQNDVNGIQERVLGWQFGQQDLPRAAHEFNGLPVEWKGLQSTIDDHKPCAIVLKSPNFDALRAIADELIHTGNVSVTRSGSTYLEVRPLGSDKGIALEWVARRLGLSSNQVLAIGDNDNDVEMLKWAGIGVVVNTASPSARECADFLCDFGPFQGVVQVLRLVHEAHKYCRTQSTRSTIE